MDTISGIDHLLERILSHLCGSDLVNSQLVCQRWYSISRRVLSRRSSCVFYLSDLTECSNKPFVSPSTTDDDGREFSGILWDNDRCESLRLKPSPDFGDKVEHFLTSQVMCAPLCSIAFGHLQAGFAPDCSPAVVIRGRGVIFQPRIDREEMEINSNSVISPRTMASLVLSKYYSDYRVQITDWEDPKSIEPVIGTKSETVKTILVFLKDHRHLMNNERFLDFLTKVGPLKGNILITGPVESIFYRRHPSRSKDYLESGLLSLAFGGEGIKTAKCSFVPTDQEQIQGEIISFKKSLDFDPNSSDADQQTFGFIFDHICSHPVYLYIKSIQAIFPKVTFFGSTFTAFPLVDIFPCGCDSLPELRTTNSDDLYEDLYEDYDYLESIVPLTKVEKLESDILSRIDSTMADGILVYRGVSIILIHLSKVTHR
ncbi:uncharacterized protein LOC141851800 [Brevipalpus obovatus]|uniref:uncharacterized protein LOC141851800 n=1 Tax=Brevipalpus obovatus TaxID=246614 RepID=UPI003D9E8A02